MNRFFFITSYDTISAAALASIIDIHPDIECKVSYSADPFFGSSRSADSSNVKIDEFITLNTNPDKKFSGNAQQFSAFELKHKTLMEKTAAPYTAADILVSPITRINFILRTWMKLNLQEDQLLEHIKQQLKSMLAQKHKLFKLYAFNYFYDFIKNTVSENKLADLTITRNKLFVLALTLVITHDAGDIPTPGKKFCFEKLLTNSDELIAFLNHLTHGKCEMNDGLREQLELKMQTQNEILNKLEFPQWLAWQTELLNKIINARLFTIYYPHIDKALSTFYADAGYNLEPERVVKPLYNKLVSLQLNSNRPAQLSAYFDNIEETADDASQIEVLVNIDIGNNAMKSLLDNEIPNRKFTLKYIETERPKSFCDLWEPINKLLAITDPDAYFLLNISDEMFFDTKGWDTILKKYVGFFPDHLFRLRASRNKFRNYFDRWECSFAQDAIPITTKKWIDIGGDWNPCFGPDSFQQLIILYLAKEGMFTNTHYLREAPLTEIKFAGDVPALGIDKEKAWRHSKDHIIAMQICQSYPMQLEARRRAILMKAHIVAHQNRLENFSVVDVKSKKRIELHDNDSKVILEKMDYSVSRLAINLTNQWRKLAFFSYFGDGKAGGKNIIRSFLRYLKARHHFFFNLHKQYNKVKNLIKKIIRPRKISKIKSKLKEQYTKRLPRQVHSKPSEIYETTSVDQLKNLVPEHLFSLLTENSHQAQSAEIEKC